MAAFSPRSGKFFLAALGALLTWSLPFSAHAQGGGGATSVTITYYPGHSFGFISENGGAPSIYTGGNLDTSINSATIMTGSSSGALTVVGTITRAPGGNLAVTSTPTTTGTVLGLTTGATFTVGGTLSLTGGSAITLSSTLAANDYTVNSGGTLTLNAGSTIGAGAVVTTGGGAGLIINGNISGFDGRLDPGSGATIINGGTLTMGTGTNLNGGILSFGGATTINVAGGGVLTGGGAGILKVGDGSTLVGPISVATGTSTGILTVTGATGTLNLNGSINNVGPLTYGNLVNIEGGTLNLTGGTVVPGGTLTLGGGTVVLTGGSPLGPIITGNLPPFTIFGNPSGTLSIHTTAAFTVPATGINVKSINVALSTQLNLNVPANFALNLINTPISPASTTLIPTTPDPNVVSGTSARFLDGVVTAGGKVSLLYLPAVQNLATNPLTLTIAETGNPTHGKYVLEMTYDPTIMASLGDVMNSYLGYLNPTTNAWENAVNGNSDAGAGAHFVSGAYDPTSDFNLGYYGVDTANNDVWAVLDFDGTFGAANTGASAQSQLLRSEIVFQPQTAPEPSAAVLLAFGAAVFGRRRKR